MYRAKLSLTREEVVKLLRKIASLLLLVAFFTPFSATYLWPHIQKALIKKEVKAKLIAGIDKSELTHLTFSKSQIETELRWKHSKEFGYKGEMYDVIETEICCDSIRYVCWHDKAETELNKRLQTLIAQATSGTPEHRMREILCYQLLKSLALNRIAQLTVEPPLSIRTFEQTKVEYEFTALKQIEKPPKLTPLPPYPTL